MKTPSIKDCDKIAKLLLNSFKKKCSQYNNIKHEYLILTIIIEHFEKYKSKLETEIELSMDEEDE